MIDIFTIIVLLLLAYKKWDIFEISWPIKLRNPIWPETTHIILEKLHFRGNVVI